MNSEADIDQFQLLEEKIDRLIAMIGELREEKETLAENARIQDERIADLTTQLESLKSSRDRAKQRIISLLEKMEQIGI
jgi:FtsZ-binding cell division protein ZapB